ncbi:baseplate megatron protein TIM-barrel domain-containing protein [Wolbachia endosymbiont of Mansonella ozzardi]|uniref:baseplate megatron protein TIM-barrel domain-containing protein n=1 Tax=Wolbachia endosymbiont of Mansonella ozzardi TaxID=137464 RepID=UPI001CE1140F
MEGFIIGSEFVQLTKVENAKGNYPAVMELAELAKQIRLQLGKEVAATYAADWNEYHSMMIGIISMNFGLRSISTLLAWMLISRSLMLQSLLLAIPRKI